MTLPTDTASACAEMSSANNTQDNKLVVVAGETFVRFPPKFSGVGLGEEDLLVFIEKFKETAMWNNWNSDARKTELLFRCLHGLAKDWFQTHLIETDEYRAGSLVFESIGCGEETVLSSLKLNLLRLIGYTNMKLNMILEYKG